MDDKSEEAKDESVDVSETTDKNEDDEKDSEDSEAESDQKVSGLSRSDDAKPKEKRAAWVDEDDHHYT